MTLYNESNEEVAKTINIIPSISTETTKNKIIDISSEANPPCNIKSIFPKLEGVRSSFFFEFDYTLLNKVLNEANSHPNRITLFLPENLFQEDEMLECSSTDIPEISCSFSNRSELRIELKMKFYKPGTSNKFMINVNNMQNKSVEIEKLSYYCQFSSVDELNKEKIQGFGSGKYIQVIDSPTGTLMKLLYYSCPEENYTKTPRPIKPAFLKFCFAFDKSSQHGDSFDFSVGFSPSLFIELPQYFPVISNPQTITATLAVVRSSSDSSSYRLLPETHITTTTPTNHGHTLKITIKANTTGDATTFYFSEDIEYFIVTLSNVSYPEDVVNDTGMLNFYILNDNNSFYARTYSNTNNFSQGGTINSGFKFLNFERGFKFNFTSDDWIGDFKTASGLDKDVNKLHIVSGFYNPIRFSTRSNGNLQSESAKALITLHSTEFDFKLKGDTVQHTGKRFSFYTIRGSVDLELGVPCLTHPGKYLITVLSETNSPHKVLTVKTLKCDFPLFEIPKNSKIKFFCEIPNTFDSFNLIYKNITIDDNSSNSLMSSRVIGDKVVNEFSSNFTDKTHLVSKVNFKVHSDNYCLNMDSAQPEKEVSITLSDIEIPSLTPADLDNMTFMTKNEKSELQADEFLFSFSIPAFNNLICILNCMDKTFPTDDELYKLNVTKSNMLNYFEAESTDSKQIIERSLKGMKRSEQYKMHCLLVTNKASANLQYVSKTFLNLRRGLDIEPVPITLKPVFKSECVKFVFSKKIMDNLKEVILKYCQNLFPFQDKSGCTVCIDRETKYHIDGVTYEKPGCLEGRRLSEEVVPTVIEEVYSYNVCAVQSVVCASDINESDFFKSIDEFSKDLSTGKLMEENLFGIKEERRMLQIINIPLLSNKHIREIGVDSLKLCQEAKEKGCVVVENTKFDFFGEFQLDLTFHDDLICNYKIDFVQSGEMNNDKVNNCNGICGKFSTIGGYSISIKGPGSRYKRGTNIGFYISCPYIDVENPQIKMDNFLKVYEHNFPILEKKCPNPKMDFDIEIEECKCVDSVGNIIDQGDEGPPGSTSFLGLSILLLLSFII